MYGTGFWLFNHTVADLSTGNQTSDFSKKKTIMDVTANTGEDTNLLHTQ